MMEVTSNQRVVLSEREQQVASEFVESVRQTFTDELLSVILFGSRARGDAQSESDMDLAVLLSYVDDQIRHDIRDLAADVWLEHGIFISVRVWDTEHWTKLQAAQTSLYQNIHRDGIGLFERETTPGR